MAAKSLNRLSREDLLLLLIERTSELDSLKEMLAQKESESQSRQESNTDCHSMMQPGSIALEALQANRLFEDAQKAADCYLDEIKAMKEECIRQCDHMLNDARNEARLLIEESQRKAAQMEADTYQQCSELRQIAEQSARHNWTELTKRIDQLCETIGELRTMIASSRQKRGFHL